MLSDPESIIAQVRALAAPLTSVERLALIRAIASLEPTSGGALPAPEAEANALQAEQAAWFARPREERQRYAGQYVAVRGGQVVDHDPDQRALYLRVRARFGREHVLIVKADWDAEPEFIIHSPRLER